MRSWNDKFKKIFQTQKNLFNFVLRLNPSALVFLDKREKLKKTQSALQWNVMMKRQGDDVKNTFTHSVLRWKIRKRKLNSWDSLIV